MGLYDCQCMITGLSLGDATAVLLRRSGEAYQPIALGITGTYSREGSVDGIREDANTGLVLTYFLDRLRDGRFAVDTDYLPLTDLDELLWCLERNNLYFDELADDPVATLDGVPVVFAMIAQPVWDALATTVTASQGALEGWFRELFGDSPVAGEIYQGRLPEVSEQVRQLFAVNDFVANRGLAWAPPWEPSQRYPTDYGGQHASNEVREFLAEAKREYGDSAVLQAAFDAYEVEVGDLLGVDEETDSADEPGSGYSLPPAHRIVMEREALIVWEEPETAPADKESPSPTDDGHPT